MKLNPVLTIDEITAKDVVREYSFDYRALLSPQRWEATLGLLNQANHIQMFTSLGFGILAICSLYPDRMDEILNHLSDLELMNTKMREFIADETLSRIGAWESMAALKLLFPHNSAFQAPLELANRVAGNLRNNETDPYICLSPLFSLHIQFPNQFSENIDRTREYVTAFIHGMNTVKSTSEVIDYAERVIAIYFVYPDLVPLINVDAVSKQILSAVANEDLSVSNYWDLMLALVLLKTPSIDVNKLVPFIIEPDMNGTDISTPLIQLQY